MVIRFSPVPYYIYPIVLVSRQSPARTVAHSYPGGRARTRLSLSLQKETIIYNRSGMISSSCSLVYGCSALQCVYLYSSLSLSSDVSRRETNECRRALCVAGHMSGAPAPRFGPTALQALRHCSTASMLWTSTAFCARSQARDHIEITGRLSASLRGLEGPCGCCPGLGPARPAGRPRAPRAPTARRRASCTPCSAARGARAPAGS